MSRRMQRGEHYPRVICAVCGKNCASRLPKGGDGTVRFPRWHGTRAIVNGIMGEPVACEGIYQDGIWPGEVAAYREALGG